MMRSPSCFRSCLAAALLAITALLAGCHKKTVPSWPPIGTSGSPDKPFNVVWKGEDLNGLPLNPDWGTQIPTNSQLPPPSTPQKCVREPDTKPDCTDQDAVRDKPVFPNIAICSLVFASVIHGHANWMPVEYVGGMAWWNFADDWDYNFAMVPVSYAGLTNNNNSIDPRPNTPEKFIEAEFDSRETTDRFVTPWWTTFRQTVAGLDNDATNSLLGADQGRVPQAVIVGLFGLDCEHDCRSEVHPVYALAVEVSDRADDNVWAIFVRNWGNEGFCSQYDHQMNFSDSKITLMLPRASKGTVAVDQGSTEFAVTPGSGISFPAVEQVTGEGTKVTFALPPPGQHALAELVLHLKWTNDTYTPPPWKLKVKNFKAFMTAMKPNATQPAAKEEGKVEDVLRSLYPLRERVSSSTANRPGEAARLQLLQALPAVNVRAQVPAVASLLQSKHQAIARPQAVPQGVLRVDSQKIARDCELIRDICSKYHNQPPTDQVPNFPQLCAELNQPDACTNAASRAQTEFQRAGPR